MKRLLRIAQFAALGEIIIWGFAFERLVTSQCLLFIPGGDAKRVRQTLEAARPDWYQLWCVDVGGILRFIYERFPILFLATLVCVATLAVSLWFLGSRVRSS